MESDVADRLAIRELMERYADAVIRRAAPDWAATWAERDAQWRFAGASAAAPVPPPVLGKANIVNRWEKRMAEVEHLYFHVQPAAITIDGDRAQARSHTLELFGLGSRAPRLVQGRYDDELVREDGAWRFCVRTFTRVAESPA